MGSIKQLSGATSELICSGQVIRNLADIVKELVENSLDSGATSIEVICRNYGLDGLEVIDNGSGIREEDLPSIPKRHYSSKIDKFDDLKTIQTHGFRGEALSSICAIAKVTVITRHDSAPNGTKTEFDTSGRIVQSSSFTRPAGTTIQIKDLFVSLPVRKRVFEENYKKDYNEMLRKISNYAIGYQGLRLVCRNQILKKTTDDICVRQNDCVKDNIIQMFSLKLYQTLIVFRQSPVEREVADEFKLLNCDLAQQKLVKIEGFLSNREKTSGRSSTVRHFFFLNTRPIEYKKLSKLITDTYKQFNGAQCPFILLRVIVPSERIDLNLSPDKFTQNILGLEPLVFAIIKQSILKMNEDCVQQKSTSSSQTAKGSAKESAKVSAKESTIENEITNRGKRAFEGSLVESSSVCTPAKAPRPAVGQQLNAHLRGFGVDISPESDGADSDQQDARSRPTRSKAGRSPTKATRRALPSFQEIVKGASSTKKDYNRTPKATNGLANFQIKYERAEKDDEQMSIDQFLVRRGDHPTSGAGDQIVDLCESNPTGHQLGNLANDKENHQVSDNLMNNQNQNKDNELSSVPGEFILIADDDPINVEDAIKTSRIKVIEGSQTPANDDDDDLLILTNPQVVAELNLSGGEMSDNSIDELLSNTKLIQLDEPPLTQDYANICYTADVSMNEIRANFKASFQIDQATSQNSRFSVRTFNVSQDEKAGQELYTKLGKADFGRMRVIGQFNSGFIIAELDSDVFIVDQHAADERYNFEKVCAELELKPLKCVKPSQLELTAHDENIIIDHLQVFEKNGFRFLINPDAAIGTRIKLDCVPLSRSQVFSIKDLQEIIDSIVEMDNLPPTYRPANIKRMLGYQACRKSVMIGDMIDEPKMRQILQHLSTCAHPTICAHGRPVLRVLFNINEFRFSDLAIK